MKTSVAWTLCALAAVTFTGCSRLKTTEAGERQLSAAQTQANSLVNHIFIEKGGDWFAAERRSATKSLLVQFHHPSVNLVAQIVTETDRMNGITERHNLVFECSQWRSWDGQWGEWRQGTSGAASLVNTFVAGGAFGYGSFRLELKNGAWSVRNMMPIHDFIEDRDRISHLLTSAAVSPATYGRTR